MSQPLSFAGRVAIITGAGGELKQAQLCGIGSDRVSWSDRSGGIGDCSFLSVCVQARWVVLTHCCWPLAAPPCW